MISVLSPKPFEQNRTSDHIYVFFIYMINNRSHYDIIIHQLIHEIGYAKLIVFSLQGVYSRKGAFFSVSRDYFKIAHQK